MRARPYSRVRIRTGNRIGSPDQQAEQRRAMQEKERQAAENKRLAEEKRADEERLAAEKRRLAEEQRRQLYEVSPCVIAAHAWCACQHALVRVVRVRVRVRVRACRARTRTRTHVTACAQRKHVGPK